MKERLVHDLDSFSTIDGVDWISDPPSSGQYAERIYDRRRSFTKEGSVLPLPLARVHFEDIDQPSIVDQFDILTHTVAHEIEGPKLALLRPTRAVPGSRRPHFGWHVDRSLRIDPFYGFRFQFSATKNPMLTTRYAPEGSRVVSNISKLHSVQPEPEGAVLGDGDVVYLMPLRQTVHASPEQKSASEAILISRFVHFAFEAAIDNA